MTRQAGASIPEVPAVDSGVRPAMRVLSDALADLFVDLGVHTAFGVLGGAIAPVYDAIGRSRVQLVHCRHETGAAFAAIEAHFAANRPMVVFTTTGPGTTNAVTGLMAAKWEGAKIIFVTGTTSASQRGRHAFQETSAYTMPSFFSAGPLFDYAIAVEDPGELDEIAARLAAGMCRPEGFVAGIGIPVALQRAHVSQPSRKRYSAAPEACDSSIASACAHRLAQEPFVIWVGFGARAAAPQVRALAERTGAMVMCTPRGKGIFPEDHPQFLGVTGVGGDPWVNDELVRLRPARILVLGTRLSEFSSFWDSAAAPRVEFIHVDVDREVPGTAFPAATTYAVRAEVSAFLDALLREFPAVVAPLPVIPTARAQHLTLPAVHGHVRPRRLLDLIQHFVVDRSDAIVMADAGNSIVWATHTLRFREPGRYRVSTRFGSMGHATTGVVGASLGRRGKAVALVGDGAMLMLNELSTAVSYRIPAVWIVMNNARYAMTWEGMTSVGFEPRGTEIREVDFAMVARGIGVQAVRVEHESGLEGALRAAMNATEPFLIDVVMERDEPAPSTKRNKTLVDQWASTNKK